ncbi:hypothetical protein PBI_LICORICE_90 [Mycobacterium phage Licorice]|nr:hypothetical protein PBI_LICORICE_90 [Mycobacterium phage Licorice]
MYFVLEGIDGTFGIRDVVEILGESGTWSGPDTESQKPRIAPGDRVYHNGEPVTVLHAGPARTHFIRGHHSWTAGYTRDLSGDEHHVVT